jgi:hypothetical protein
MSILGVHLSVAVFLLVLCVVALLLLMRLHGVGPAVMVAVVLSVIGTVAFLHTFGITV